MKKLLFLGALLLSELAAASQPLFLPIVEIHDGDTIKTNIPLPEPLNEISIRVNNVDTPEMPAKSYQTTGKLGRAKCVQEAELAIKARNAIINLANGSKIMKVTNYDYGKFAGRILGDVEINGVDIATYEIDNNLAVPYFGGEKTKDWCE